MKELYAEENEAFMFDMINNGGHGNGIGTEEDTQVEAYDIDGQPFFNVSSANCIAFYTDGQGEDESEDEEEDDADTDDDIPEDATATVGECSRTS
jgi:hypothetical protein